MPPPPDPSVTVPLPVWFVIVPIADSLEPQVASVAGVPLVALLRKRFRVVGA
jgi:hypothetical protein